MSKFNLLAKIEQVGLTGRGGAGFPVHQKWRRMLDHSAVQKYVVCNASEGEPGVKKDFYLLKNYPERVLQGMILAMDFLGTKEGYLYLNRDYYEQLKTRLDRALKTVNQHGFLINLFLENPSYIGGESGALLNTIEGKKTQPRNKPPSPSITGINGKPVLLHNVETFYDVALVARGEYRGERLVTFAGVKHEGVQAVDESLTVAEVLRQTDNYPDFAFIAQIGGGASGPVFNQEQLESEKLMGCGSVEIYPADKPALELLNKWADFYNIESCGKCTPCREGSYQLRTWVNQALVTGQIDESFWQRALDLGKTMALSSICGLGQSLIIPLESYYLNVWQKNERS